MNDERPTDSEVLFRGELYRLRAVNAKLVEALDDALRNLVDVGAKNAVASLRTKGMAALAAAKEADGG